MKVTYNETVKREIEVPGHYGYDESLKGQMVDILLGGSHIREDIYGEDKPVVLNAIALLEGAYEKVEKILTIVRDHPEALK